MAFDRRLALDSAEHFRARRLLLSELAVPAGRGWHPAHQAMAEALHEPPADIAGVIARLETIGALLDTLPPSPANNRVGCFNQLYLKITKKVDEALRTRAASPDFLELLDVEFARRYFAAMAQWNLDEDATPDVWEVLFKRAGDLEMSSLVAAVLGVNAHINHDLALALISTWSQLGAPDEEVVHPDYLLVNEIFYAEIPPLRQSFSTEWHLAIDGFVGPLDDWSQRVLVTATRARAWDQGRRLWDLRHDADDFEQARLTMDRAASLLGEWLITGDRMVTATGEMTDRGRRLLRRLGLGDDDA